MSAQKSAQSDDPIELLADSLNVWVGKLSDLVHKVIDTEPIRNVINWARMYSLWPVNITTACCSAEFGAASGARHDLERFGEREDLTGGFLSLRKPPFPGNI